jgi:hypothetical protein
MATVASITLERQIMIVWLDEPGERGITFRLLGLAVTGLYTVQVQS